MPNLLFVVEPDRLVFGEHEAARTGGAFVQTVCCEGLALVRSVTNVFFLCADVCVCVFWRLTSTEAVGCVLSCRRLRDARRFTRAPRGRRELNPAQGGFRRMAQYTSARQAPIYLTVPFVCRRNLHAAV
ncbi:unnamed protein product [Scytosiphon promiscuus]